jgi:hypothetical protein
MKQCECFWQTITFLNFSNYEKFVKYTSVADFHLNQSHDHTLKRNLAHRLASGSMIRDT